MIPLLIPLWSLLFYVTVYELSHSYSSMDDFGLTNFTRVGQRLVATTFWAIKHVSCTWNRVTIVQVSCQFKWSPRGITGATPHWLRFHLLVNLTRFYCYVWVSAKCNGCRICKGTTRKTISAIPISSQDEFSASHVIVSQLIALLVGFIWSESEFMVLIIMKSRQSEI
jgi:hypothetical protein